MSYGRNSPIKDNYTRTYDNHTQSVFYAARISIARDFGRLLMFLSIVASLKDGDEKNMFV